MRFVLACFALSLYHLSLELESRTHSNKALKNPDIAQVNEDLRGEKKNVAVWGGDKKTKKKN